VAVSVAAKGVPAAVDPGAMAVQAGVAPTEVIATKLAQEV